MISINCVLVACVTDIPGLVDPDRLIEPLLPALIERLGVFLQLFLQGFGNFDRVERAFGCLLGHRRHVLQPVAGIGDRHRGFFDLLVQPQLAHAFAQGTGQLADAVDNPFRGFIAAGQMRDCGLSFVLGGGGFSGRVIQGRFAAHVRSPLWSFCR